MAIDMNPTTQGKVHPLQRPNENFLGYFSLEFFPRIAHATKRIVLDAPENAALHVALRTYPVFVDHTEALERHYALRTPRRVEVSAELLGAL